MPPQPENVSPSRSQLASESPTLGKLSFREMAGYSLGDASANFVFQILIIFQAGFYTDVMGIPAATLGLMLLLVRFSDAISDPLMGIIADRTNHRWGKFRPWLVWSALPFAFLFWVAFTVPAGLSDSMKVVYAATTYTLLMIAYTMNNVPYSALMGVMTADPGQRTKVSSYRFVAGIGAAFVVQGFTLPLVGKLGGGDDALGWSRTVAIFAGISIVFFVITFLSAKERVKPPPGQKPDLAQDFRDVGRNPAWLAMFGMTLFVFITLSLRGGSYYYYFTYFVDPAALTQLLEDLDLSMSVEAVAGGSLGTRALDLFGLVVTPGGDPSKVGFSLFNMLGSLVNILGILVAKPLADRFGKKLVFTLGLSVAALVQVSFLLLGPADVGTMLWLQVLSCAAYGPTIPLLWAMMADTADYAEWKTGRRSTGFVFSGLVFALKAGLGLGGAVSGWLLSSYGYTPSTAHSPEVLAGIRNMASLYSALPFALGAMCMLFYPIDKALNLRVCEELENRRLASLQPV